MAFNPFTWFRKHQKVLFAGLTLLVMLVFIGSFGRGDIFETATRWVSGRSTGQTVTTLYGKKVREGDVLRSTLNRKLASNFLFANAWKHHANVCAELLKDQLQSTQPDNPLSGLREIVQSIQQRTGTGLFMSRVPASFLRIQIEEELNRLEAIATRDKVKNDSDNLNLVRRVATMLGFQYWITGDRQIQEALAFAQTMMMGGRNLAFPTSLYFGGSEQIEDILDFMVWRGQADKLGIQLTDADLAREINAEAAGAEIIDPKIPFDSNPEVSRFMTTQPGMNNVTHVDLLDGLRDEFRVVMTQAALLGTEPGVRAYRLALGATSSPAMATPDEFLTYFREQRTTLRVQLLSVPVEQFVSQIQQQPTEAELLTRFEHFREREPKPNSREPGFKEPRRVQVEYVYASPEDPHYRDLSKAKLFAWAAGTVGSTNPIEAAASVLSDPLHKDYERELLNGDSDWFYNPRASLSMLEEQLKKLHYVSILKPTVLASTIAGQTTGSTLGALSNLYGLATNEEVKSSTKFTLTQLLANANPQALLGNAALFVASLPAPPSYEVLEPQILANVIDRNAEEALRENLKKLGDELQKLRGRAKEAKEFVSKAAKDYHLKYLQMPRAMTRDGILEAIKKKEDLNLKPLREALVNVTRSERPEDFVENLFMQQRTGTFEPIPFATRTPRKEEFIFWRSQDLVPRTREFAEVRSEVEAAWRLEKARQLARKEAERLEAEINKAQFNAADAVRFLNEQKFGPVFELDNVAQLVPPREVLAARRTEYSPYQIPEDKRSLFEYPPADLAKRLLKLKRPGEATVIVDEPGKHYFVCVLLDRTEPTMEEFKAIYARTPKEDSLFSRFLTQKRADYRKSILEQLRREAAGADNLNSNGTFKIPEFARRDASPRDEE